MRNFKQESITGAFSHPEMNEDLTESLRSFFRVLGEDPKREGLEKTPKRIINSFLEQTWGLRVPEDEFLKEISAEFDSSMYDEMISVRNISFCSLCEHHFLPFLGTATIAYIPNKTRNKIVGLSKIPRILEYCAARPQVQERLTIQIAEMLVKLADPEGVAVSLKAAHMCMELRGVKSVGSLTTTTHLHGVFRTNSSTRLEFLSLLGA